MSVTIAENRADRIASLIEERLRIRGQGLEAKLRRAGRSLPKWVRREAETLVQAQQFSASPKLMKLINPAQVDQAYTRCEAWLKSVDPWDRRKGAILSVLASRHSTHRFPGKTPTSMRGGNTTNDATNRNTVPVMLIDEATIDT